MAKQNEKKYERTNIEQGMQNSNRAFSNFINPITQRAAGERNDVLAGYKNFASTGGLSDEEYQQMRDSYQQGAGAPMGANLSDFAKEKAGYGEFADTGGYDASDIQRIRSQAATSAPRLFSALKDQYALNRNNLGANASAGAGIDFKAARNAAQQSASDRLGANIGLKESVNKGKLEGLSGLTGIDTTTGNQSLANASMMNNYNLAKASGASDVEARIAAMKQSGREFGQSGQANLYGADQSNWLNAIGAGDASQRGWTGLNLQNDEVNKSGMWGNIGKGLSTAGSFLKNLFHGGAGKNQKDKPVVGKGGGGGTGTPGGGPDDSLFRGGVGDPSVGDVNERNFPNWRSSANPGETFAEWYHRMSVSGAFGKPPDDGRT